MNGDASPRVALCTLGTGPHLELLDIARPSVTAFAARHGYEHVEHRRSLAPDRPPSWSKVVALHELCGHFDRVIWIDADAIVVDDSADLATELRSGRLLGAAYHRYGGNTLPNLGVAVLRGGSLARRLLERMWRCTDLIEHPWWENAALLRVLGYRTFEPVGPDRRTWWRAAIGEIDGSWNSIPDHPAPAPRIVHLAGRPHDLRVSEMTILAERVAVRAREAQQADAPI